VVEERSLEGALVFREALPAVDHEAVLVVALVNVSPAAVETNAAILPAGEGYERRVLDDEPDGLVNAALRGRAR